MDMFDCRVASDVTYIQPSWSDHFLVTSHFALRHPTHATILGKGVWRAHPRLASSESFQALVAHIIFTTVSAFDPHMSPQDKWDKLNRIPSDLTDDYHPRRKETYFFYTTEEQDINYDESLHDMHDNYIWSIEPSINITQLCYQFKGNTLKLSNRPEQLSDIRLLALHDIYLFNLSDQSKSVGKYWCPTTYKSAVDDIPYPDPPQGQKSATWCTSISLKRHRNWIVGLTDSAKYLVEATALNNIVDIHAMQAVVELVPVFISTPLNYSIEDTYIHNWIAPILKPIFSCEPLLSIEWANKYINQHHKPDFITSVKGINSWLPIVVGEFKKPGFTPCLETDLVKTGKEMRTMVNGLVRIGVDNPSAGAILIQGRVINTFKMDIVAPNNLSILPTIVSRFLQIKEISLETARKMQALDRERAAQMKPSSLSPQYAWLSKSNLILRKVTPITSSNSDEYKNND
ncbi:hypothetical protein G6F60_012285 [Rhizopus arrhizus]|nr:hypothetical protein G6F60_012285 [Rhizopus arrhizus]